MTFNLYVYESFAYDLIFFLFMSIARNYLITNFDLFIDFFYPGIHEDNALCQILIGALYI